MRMLVFNDNCGWDSEGIQSNSFIGVGPEQCRIKTQDLRLSVLGHLTWGWGGGGNRDEIYDVKYVQSDNFGRHP